MGSEPESGSKEKMLGELIVEYIRTFPTNPDRLKPFVQPLLAVSIFTGCAALLYLPKAIAEVYELGVIQAWAAHGREWGVIILVVPGLFAGVFGITAALDLSRYGVQQLLRGWLSQATRRSLGRSSSSLD